MRYCPYNHLPFRSVYIVVWNGKNFEFEDPITPKGIDRVNATLEPGG